MEKGLDGQSLLSLIRGEFGGGDVDIRTYSPLTLAYIGDAVFEMIVRTLVVEKNPCLRYSGSVHAIHSDKLSPHGITTRAAARVPFSSTQNMWRASASPEG